MSRKAAGGIAVLLVVIVAVGVFGWWFVSEMPDGTYYTQVDNARTQELESKGGVIDPTGGMSIGYTLPAFDEAGDEKEISFGTERELREDAYLKLTVVPIRGVLEWEEVQFDDIPEKAQVKLPVPTSSS